MFKVYSPVQNKDTQIPQCSLHALSLEKESGFRIPIMAIVQNEEAKYVNTYEPKLLSLNEDGSYDFNGPIYKIELIFSKDDPIYIYYGIVTDDRVYITSLMNGRMMDTFSIGIVRDLMKSFPSLCDYHLIQRLPTHFTYYLEKKDNEFCFSNNSGTDNCSISITELNFRSDRGEKEIVFANEDILHLYHSDPMKIIKSIGFDDGCIFLFGVFLAFLNTNDPEELAGKIERFVKLEFDLASHSKYDFVKEFIKKTCPQTEWYANSFRTPDDNFYIEDFRDFFDKIIFMILKEDRILAIKVRCEIVGYFYESYMADLMVSLYGSKQQIGDLNLISKSNDRRQRLATLSKNPVLAKVSRELLKIAFC